MTTLDTLAQASARTSWRLAGWLISAFLTAFLVWSAFADIDEFAIAEGEVVPLNQVKVIQHLEGGVVQKIMVNEGDVVRAGQPLLEILLPVSGLNKDELAARLDGLAITRARLNAEIAGSDFVPPAIQAQRRPDLVQAEQRIFIAHRAEVADRLSSLAREVEQRELAIAEAQASSAAVATDLSMARQNLAMSEQLLKDGLTSKMEHLERQREVKRLEGQLASLIPTIPRAKAALAEAQTNLQEQQRKVEREAVEALSSTELDIARVRELMAEAMTQDARRILVSPEDGVVKNLRYHTIGGVIRPGDTVLELVPVDESLVIEAHLSPSDRGYVRVGERARAKISAYDYIRDGSLDGEIVFVAPDSSLTQDGKPYFKVRMKPDRFYLGDKPGEKPIVPGMVATIEVETGKKSVLEYLLKPVLRVTSGAFHER